MSPKEDEQTSIPCTKETRDRAYGFGKKGQKWDAILNELMDKAEKFDKGETA